MNTALIVSIPFTLINLVLLPALNGHGLIYLYPEWPIVLVGLYAGVGLGIQVYFYRQKKWQPERYRILRHLSVSVAHLACLALSPGHFYFIC